MTESDVGITLAGVADLETRADAIHLLTYIVSRVKPSHVHQPISPVELARIRAALDALKAALDVTHQFVPAHFEVVS